MRYLKNIIALCFFILLIAKSAFAQQADILNNLQNYGAANPQEKVYLHLDKPHYLTGDDIWLKGYVTIGPQNQLSALSKILYVDLVDPSNTVINHLKLLILNGASIGDIHLADTLQEGTYHIRAYTNWMRNLPEETFFNKAFTIGRTLPDPAFLQSTFAYDPTSKQLKTDIKLISQTGMQATQVPIKYILQFPGIAAVNGSAVTDNSGVASIIFNNNKNLDLKTGVLGLKYTVNNVAVQKSIAVNVQQPENKISFMPEGGDMIAGLQSRVAFKMLQPDGLGATGSGYITDETGAQLVDFESGYAGMGSFYFTPLAGKTYKAVVTYANGKKQTTNLPAVLAEGYNLSISRQTPAFALLSISVSPTLVKNQNVTVLVQRQGKVIYAAQVPINAAQSAVRIVKDKMPSGIIQITLFNQDMQAVCERLFFNRDARTAIPLTATLNPSYKTRQAVTVSLQAGGAADSLRAGSFSASVVNMAGLPPVKTNETSILAGLLLDPELKGYVERPDHYFELADNSRGNELDNLILCQGWRRIVWDDVKAAKLPVTTYLPEKGFAITGTVSVRNGSPVNRAKVSLLSTKSFVAIDTLTDAKGRFVFDNLLLNDLNRFAVRSKDQDGKNTILKVDKPVMLSGIVPNGHIQFPEDMAYQAFLKANYSRLPDSIKQRFTGYTALREVSITAVKDKKKQVTISANLNGPGNADQVFLADELKNSFSLKQFLEGRAMGIKFYDDVAYTTRGDNFGHNPTDPMRIQLDGTELNLEGEQPLNWIPVDDVQSIEILRTSVTTAVYGQNNGIIIITTKSGKGLNRDSKPSPEYAPIVVSGYQTIREFYAPDYAVTKPNAAPDHRTTVFWKPDIITDKNGNATFKFYTTDDRGTYQLDIQGLTSDSRPAQLLQTIKVE